MGICQRDSNLEKNKTSFDTICTITNVYIWVSNSDSTDYIQTLKNLSYEIVSSLNIFKIQVTFFR